MKKNYTQQLQKIPPPTGGGHLTSVWKNSKLFLQIMGEMKRAPQAKIFVTGTIFTPKMQKNGQQKIHPPVGGDFFYRGGQKTYLIWSSPLVGG